MAQTSKKFPWGHWKMRRQRSQTHATSGFQLVLRVQQTTTSKTCGHKCLLWINSSLRWRTIPHTGQCVRCYHVGITLTVLRTVEKKWDSVLQGTHEKILRTPVHSPYADRTPKRLLPLSAREALDSIHLEGAQLPKDLRTSGVEFGDTYTRVELDERHVQPIDPSNQSAFARLCRDRDFRRICLGGFFVVLLLVAVVVGATI